MTDEIDDPWDISGEKKEEQEDPWETDSEKKAKAAQKESLAEKQASVASATFAKTSTTENIVADDPWAKKKQENDPWGNEQSSAPQTEDTKEDSSPQPKQEGDPWKTQAKEAQQAFESAFDDKTTVNEQVAAFPEEQLAVTKTFEEVPQATAFKRYTEFEKLMPEEPIRFTREEMDRMLLFCEQHETSDVTIQSGSPIMAEIQGRLFRVTSRTITHNEASEMINAIYGPNGTTQINSGKDVDTHYEIRPDRISRFRYRVNGTGCQVEGHDALQITIRTIPTDPPDLSTMDLPQELLDAIAPQQGTVIVTGSTGSGKSTLLASIVKELAKQHDGHRKILTYESPIEFVYDSVEMPTSIVSQSEIPRHLPSFADGIRNALRRKPRLILVGEARDPETIAAAIDAALTGHPVYTTLHSNGVADAVRRMISVFPAEERNGRALDILETIRLMIWQKLVPTVDRKRVALREYLIFDESVRDVLVQTDVEKIAAKTRELLKSVGQPMEIDAKKKFDEGIISERDYNLFVAGARYKDKDLM